MKKRIEDSGRHVTEGPSVGKRTDLQLTSMGCILKSRDDGS
jgi:hypothetical protein